MRKAARNQKLPEDEVAYLLTLSGVELKARCYALYQAGWPASTSASAIGMSAPTIRNWVAAGPHHPSGGLSSDVVVPVPLPVYRTYVHKKPKNPGINALDRRTLSGLAPLARKYRATLPSNHVSTIANSNLTRLCVELHRSGVPLQEIATATGVSYRAMHRRVTNALRKV